MRAEPPGMPSACHRLTGSPAIAAGERLGANSFRLI